MLLLLSLAGIALKAQTAGGVMDSRGNVRHFVTTGACVFPLEWVVLWR